MSVEDVESTSGASCALDPIPTWIMKQCKQELIPTINEIINKSPVPGDFPKPMTNALVKTLINKTSLDPSEYRNYRYVCNVGVVSKVIERVVANQLKDYLSDNILDQNLPSAYPKNIAQ